MPVDAHISWQDDIMSKRIPDSVLLSLRWRVPGFGALACLLIIIGGIVAGTILDARSIQIYKTAPTIHVSYSWTLPVPGEISPSSVASVYP